MAERGVEHAVARSFDEAIATLQRWRAIGIRVRPRGRIDIGEIFSNFALNLFHRSRNQPRTRLYGEVAMLIAHDIALVPKPRRLAAGNKTED